ncbi:hypothetical protein SNEBB_008088 [Seison nebaliae]|nr:hypothetical protein SNEBB_008088 [Seison nebaliae]
MLLNKINAKKLHARNRTFQINDLPNDYLLQLNNFDMWKTILHFIAVLNLFILIILLIKFVFNFYAAKNGLKRLQDQIYNSMMLAVENLKSKKYNIQAVINSGLENVKQHNYCDQLRQQEMATSVQS